MAKILAKLIEIFENHVKLVEFKKMNFTGSYVASVKSAGIDFKYGEKPYKCWVW